MAKKSITLFDSMDNTGRYMLNVGAPGPLALKDVTHIMKQATDIRLTEELDEGCCLLQYGDPNGDRRCIEALAVFLTQQYKTAVYEKHIVVSAGATSGLFYLLMQMFPNKCTIYVEELTYFIAIKVLNSLGYTLESIHVEGDGINLDHLAEVWERDLTKKANSLQGLCEYSAVLYLVPHFHNPTGSVLAPEKCEKLIKLARRYKVLVICDDVYNLLYYTEKVPSRLFEYDKPTDPDYRSGTVVSNGTFSKLLSPGLRVGWMELPPLIKDKYWTKSPLLNSGGNLNTYTSGVIAIALERNWVSKFIEKIKQENGEKMRILVRTCKERLSKDFKFFHEPTGGYFALLLVPLRLDAKKLIAYLRFQYDIRTHDGSRFFSGINDENNLRTQKLCNSIRLSISYPQISEVKEGVELMCEGIKAFENDVNYCR
uniref:Aminotran_1_2 domain-containing protein n=1 Tax=Parastrongyloides trichosuri TaxID=131310 RepID=A0A0N4Z3M3_PARTI